MISLRGVTSRLKLQHVLFLLLLLSGIIPLAIISTLLISQNRDLLETQEKSYLTASARSLSVELDSHVRSLEQQLRQAGRAILSVPEPAALEERLRTPWVAESLQELTHANRNLLGLRVLTADGSGARFGAVDLPPAVSEEMDRAFGEARERGRLGGAAHVETVYRFLAMPSSGEPLVLVAASIPSAEADGALIVDGLTRLPMLANLFERQAGAGEAAFLIDRGGRVLWAGGAGAGMQAAMAGSEVVQDFARLPLAMTREYVLEFDGDRWAMQAQVSPLETTGWGVVVQKPAAQAYPMVRKMVLNTVLSSVLLVLLALLIALTMARKVSQPIQRLAETSHEIAAGKFGQRVEEGSLGRELGALAQDFNLMSAYVERYVEELRRAAQANRDLFIGSIRAFAATIDAKDPYTRGHSERVAEYSRSLARHLGLAEELRQRVWVGALLHDVGKIGIDDSILKKGGALTPEEFTAIKRHPVIGAEILSPIDQLAPMLSAVRWHHESWNGDGYPDGLKGEEIPLMARIVAVADCFDAVTTHRPYQQGYSQEYAVETITNLAGKRFDAKVVTAFLRAWSAGEIRDRRSHGEEVGLLGGELVDAEAVFSI